MDKILLPVSKQDEDVIKAFLSKEVVDSALEKTYTFVRLMSYYKCAMMEIETKFKVLNEQFSLMYDRQPISTIKTRLKNPISIRDKMVSNGFPFSFESMEENLNDIAGVRVICSFVDDVYMVAEALKKQDDIVLIEEKDYIRNPKGNGYRSLHLIVEVPIFLQDEKRIMTAEVQLRTISMDSWASLEHQLRYKKSQERMEKYSDKLRRCAEISAELDEHMNQIKLDLYGEKNSERTIYPLVPDVMNKSEQMEIYESLEDE